MRYDIVVLSSSPPTAPEPRSSPLSPLHGNPPPSPRRVPMPSSPLRALSPLASLHKRPSGASAVASRKAPIPPDAIRGFATVGSLVRSEHFAQQVDDDDTLREQAQPSRRSSGDIGEVAVAASKPKKRSAKSTSAEGSTKPKAKPRTRKPTAAKNISTKDPELRLPAPKVSPFFTNSGTDSPIEAPVQDADEAPKLTKSGKPRKQRTKKDKPDGDVAQPKPKKPRSVKTKVAGSTTKKEQTAASVESTCFRGGDRQNGAELGDVGNSNDKSDAGKDSIWEIPQSPPRKKKRAVKQRPADPLADGLNLEAAVSRRRDWTPPKDTILASPSTNSVGKENKEVGVQNTGHQFTSMISNFAYAHTSSQQTTAPAVERDAGASVVTKRRRVELVDIPGNQTNSRNSSPDKEKAPKKKPRTITDRATEAYLPQHPFAPAAVTSNFFEPRTTTTKIPLNDAANLDSNGSPRKPARKRSTSKSGSEKAAGKAKTKKPTKSSAKPKLVAGKLLSPLSAMDRMNKQDILFGTSSQLAIQESPTLVRQIQYALKESEIEAEASLTSRLDAPRWPRLGKVEGKRGLWHASSRDDEGGLLEQMDDVYIPEFDRTQDIPLPLLTDGTLDVVTNPTMELDRDKASLPVLISSDPPTPAEVFRPSHQPLAKSDEQIQDHVMSDPAFEDIDEFSFRPPPSNQKASREESFADIDDLDLPPSAQLKRPPTLPHPASLPAAESAKKRRGRPPKPASATKSATSPPKLKKSVSAPPLTPSRGSARFINIEEILDSEDEQLAALSPTPPRSRTTKPSEPLSLFSLSSTRGTTTTGAAESDLMPIHKIPSSHLSYSAIKSQIFTSITTHIRSLAPSTNPSHPTWHEKILMYTPLVLEDFTAYLNTHTTIRAYKKASQKQIKAWNKEMKRTRGEEVGLMAWEEDLVLAVEKELEAWQIRDWCESLSICCVWGEGRGKGGARKGLY